MQEHHPRFRYHEANWLIRHIAISHLISMNRKFRRMGVDPDVKVYQQYLERKALKTTGQRRTEMKRPIPHGVYKVCQPHFILLDIRYLSTAQGACATSWDPENDNLRLHFQDSETASDCELSVG